MSDRLSNYGNLLFFVLFRNFWFTTFFVGEPLTKEEMEEREIRRRRRQKDKKTDFAKKLTHNFSVDFLLVGNFFLRKKN